MRIPVPPYGQGPKNPSKARTVRIEYVLPLEYPQGAHISSQFTMDWNIFVDMVEDNASTAGNPRLVEGQIESVYQGIVLHEIFSFYRLGLILPTKLTCRDTVVRRNESLMMQIRTINNYSFSAVMC